MSGFNGFTIRLKKIIRTKYKSIFINKKFKYILSKNVHHILNLNKRKYKIGILIYGGTNIYQYGTIKPPLTEVLVSMVLDVYEFRTGPFGRIHFGRDRYPKRRVFLT